MYITNLRSIVSIRNLSTSLMGLSEDSPQICKLCGHRISIFLRKLTFVLSGINF